MHIRCMLRNMRLAVRADRHFIRKFTSASRTNHRMSQPFSSTQPSAEPCSGKAFCSALHYSKHAFSCQVASKKQHTILQPEKNAVPRNSSEKRHLFIFHQVLSILFQAVIQSKSALPDSSFTVVSAGTNMHCPFWNASVSPVSAVIVPLPEMQSSTANAFVVETAAASAGVAACKCNRDT